MSLISLITIILGNVLYALTVKLFLIPADLVSGGTNGIAFAIHHLTGIPITLFVFVFNIAMLIIGLLFLGKKFALTTILSTFIYPLALEFFQRLLGDTVLTTDILLCTIFAGLGVGISLGLVIRCGASTGGMDIPPLILNRYFKVPVSVGLYSFDILIILIQAYYQPVEKVLYAILLIIVYSVMLDKILLMGNSRMEVRVISSQFEPLRRTILTELDRGVTLIPIQGGYSGQDMKMVFCIVSNRELPRLEKLIRSTDPAAFVTVNPVKEVMGRGFSLDKHWM